MISRALRALAIVLAAALSARVGFHALANAPRPTHGFAAYLTSARLLAAGERVARFYDDAWFNEKVRETTGIRSDPFAPNPPPAALLALPVARLPQASARRLVVGVELLLLFVALGLLVKELRLGPLAGGLFVAFAVVSRPVRSNLALAQAYVPMLLLLVLAFAAARRKRDGLFGAALAAMAFLKTVGLLVWLWPAAARRRRPLLSAAGAGAALFLVTLPVLRPDAWMTYARAMPTAGAPAYIAVPAIQSQTGAIRHALVLDARFSPRPLLHAPRLATALTAAAALAAALVALEAGAEGARAVAALAVASVLVSPVSSDYAWCLALPAFALLLKDSEDERSVPRTLLLCAAMALFALAPERCDLPHPPFGILATYPLVISGWLLLALLATNRSAKSTGNPRSRSQRDSAPALS